MTESKRCECGKEIERSYFMCWSCAFDKAKRNREQGLEMAVTFKPSTSVDADGHIHTEGSY
jgi:hypothetical protein